MVTKRVDSKGRLALGSEFAGRTVIVKQDAGVITVEPAVVIAEREAWLYKNTTALFAVREGLEQAKAGELSDGPDLDSEKVFPESEDD